jgi:hypothetical protein
MDWDFALSGQSRDQMLVVARDREDGTVAELLKSNIRIEYSRIHGDFLTRSLAVIIDIVL